MDSGTIVSLLSFLEKLGLDATASRKASRQEMAEFVEGVAASISDLIDCADRLSRDEEILRLRERGYSAAEVAKSRGVSKSTAENRMGAIVKHYADLGSACSRLRFYIEHASWHRDPALLEVLEAAEDAQLTRAAMATLDSWAPRRVAIEVLRMKADLAQSTEQLRALALLLRTGMSNS